MGNCGGFVERWWSPINSPVLGANGDIAAIIHRVEDVTGIVRRRSAGEASDQILRDQQNVIERLRQTVDERRAKWKNAGVRKKHCGNSTPIPNDSLDCPAHQRDVTRTIFSRNLFVL